MVIFNNKFPFGYAVRRLLVWDALLNNVIFVDDNRMQQNRQCRIHFAARRRVLFSRHWTAQQI